MIPRRRFPLWKRPFSGVMSDQAEGERVSVTCLPFNELCGIRVGGALISTQNDWSVCSLGVCHALVMGRWTETCDERDDSGVCTDVTGGLDLKLVPQIWDYLSQFL